MDRDYLNQNTTTNKTSQVGHLQLANPVWHHDDMARIDPDDPRMTPVLSALAAWQRAEQTEKRKRAEFAKAVADAIRAGVRPAVLVRRTEKSAETIRQMARENGVEPLREPTTTSIRKVRAELAAAGWDSDEQGRPTKPRHPQPDEPAAG